MTDQNEPVASVVMPYRFVGGSRDGETHSVTREWVRMPKVSKGNPNVADPFAPVEFEEYVAFRLRGESCEHVVYAHSGLSPDDVITLLILKYRA